MSSSEGWSISDGPYRLIEADGRRHTRRGLSDHPVLNIRSVPFSVRPLSCTVLKHRLALTVGSPVRLHGCAVLKHRLALAVGSLVHLHGCTALKHGLAKARPFWYIPTSTSTSISYPNQTSTYLRLNQHQLSATIV